PAGRWQGRGADHRSRHVVAVDGSGEGSRATEQVEAVEVQLVTVHGAGTLDVAHSLALGATPVAALRRAVALDPDLRSILGELHRQVAAHRAWYVYCCRLAGIVGGRRLRNSALNQYCDLDLAFPRTRQRSTPVRAAARGSARRATARRTFAA